MSYDSYENEYEDIFVIEDSNRAFEEEVPITGFGSAPVSQKDKVFLTTHLKVTVRYTHTIQWR